MKNKIYNDVVVVGFALFAMFFGAGNLIFPPTLGILAGDQWQPALLGFALTGIGMPLLGIISVSKNGGTIEKFAGKVSPTFSIILGTIIMLAIGPLLAIPRTAATTYEMGVKPLFSGASPIIASIIYFAITFFFAINPSKVIDKIGKILTPILLLMIGVIIYKGVTTPIGTPIVTGMKNTFSKGFSEGYQTMDALASIVFAGIVISNLAAKGYKDTKEQVKLTIFAGGIAASALLLVYGGLMYLGATASEIFPSTIGRTDLTISIAENILGSFGKIALGVAVSCACLTTSIGLTATVAEFFSKLTKNKLTYKTLVIAITVFSAIVSNFGVDKIVSLAVPLLVTVYPVAIVLVIMNIFSNFITRRGAYIGAVYGALFVSLCDALSVIGVDISAINAFLSKLPFADSGLGWITPAILGSIIGMILIKQKVVEVKNK